LKISIWIIICAFSLVLIATGLYIMFTMPLNVQGSNQESGQVVDTGTVEFRRIPTTSVQDYNEGKMLTPLYEPPVLVVNPFGTVFIGAGIVLPLIALEYHKERS
jgi:hypothetical protein